MWNRHLATAGDAARRAMPFLVLAAALVLSTLGATAPARADDRVRDHRDPAARLQVIVKTVHVYDDRDDWGDGELMLFAFFYRCPVAPSPCTNGQGRVGQGATLLAGIYTHPTNDTKSTMRFDADTGDTVTLNRVLPRADDVVFNGYRAREAEGYPVAPGARYVLYLSIFDEDTFEGHEDNLGSILIPFGEEDDWSVGTHNLRSSLWRDRRAGDWGAELEIRRVPLPDLRPRSIRVLDGGPSSLDVVCLDVENVGQKDTDPFFPIEMTVRVDEAVPSNGTVYVEGGVAVGQSRETCIHLELPTSGLHRLELNVDGPRGVTEMDEGNNHIEQELDRTPLVVHPPSLAYHKGRI